MTKNIEVTIEVPSQATTPQFIEDMAKVGIRIVVAPEIGFDDSYDPFRWVLASQCDETHVQEFQFRPSTKLYGYWMLDEVYLRREGRTVATWCLATRPGKDKWEIHDAVAAEVASRLDRYGWGSCPNWERNDEK